MPACNQVTRLPENIIKIIRFKLSAFRKDSVSGQLRCGFHLTLYNCYFDIVFPVRYMKSSF